MSVALNNFPHSVPALTSFTSFLSASTGTPRHVILPNMDLVLLRVDLGDSLNSYRCVVRNKITGEETLSASHNLQIQSEYVLICGKT